MTPSSVTALACQEKTELAKLPFILNQLSISSCLSYTRLARANCFGITVGSLEVDVSPRVICTANSKQDCRCKIQ